MIRREVEIFGVTVVSYNINMKVSIDLPED
jgi:hypothetical protein